MDRVFQNSDKHIVETENIGHGRKNGNILSTQKGSKVSRGDGAYHDFREPQRKGLHGCCSYRGALPAADSDHAMNFAFCVKFGNPGRQTVRHGLDDPALVASRNQLIQIMARLARHLFAGDITAGQRPAQGTGINEDSVAPIVLHQISDEKAFLTLGIEGADNQDCF